MNVLIIILGTILQLSADFYQTKQSQILVEEQVSTGHLIYRSPDYLRWEYNSPIQLVWELDGDNTNVSPQVKRLLKLIMQTIACDNLQTTADYEVLLKDGMYQLLPKNRELKQFFKSIQLEIDPKNKVAKTVVLNEKNGDVTIIKFNNICL
jgi:outer membrane lipoprotein-sorting protein